MSASSTLARIVRVKIEEGRAGLFYATSPDLRGLLVAKPTIPELESAIPSAIMDLYLACGEEVIVAKAKDGDPDFFPWIAIPTQTARKAMERAVAA